MARGWATVAVPCSCSKEVRGAQLWCRVHAVKGHGRHSCGAMFTWEVGGAAIVPHSNGKWGCSHRATSTEVGGAAMVLHSCRKGGRAQSSSHVHAGSGVGWTSCHVHMARGEVAMV